MCLSIAKQYFVHTAEPLCVSVDDEDGDPTVCACFLFYSHTLSPVFSVPIHFKDKDIAIVFLSLLSSSFSVCLFSVFPCLRVLVRLCVCV